MELITFMGCSPSLGLELKTVVSCTLYPRVCAIGGDSINKIICPNCKSLIKKPATLISNFKNNPIWQSTCCNKEIALQSINWRKSAGFSHAFIQMSHIFPKEAIPTDTLLKKLSYFSQSEWHYFYSKST